MQHSFILLYFVFICNLLNFKKSFQVSVFQMYLKYFLAIVKYKTSIGIKNKLLYILVLLANKLNLRLFFLENSLKKVCEVRSWVGTRDCIYTDNIFPHQMNYQVSRVRRKHSLNFHSVFDWGVEYFIFKSYGN